MMLARRPSTYLEIENSKNFNDRRGSIVDRKSTNHTIQSNVGDSNKARSYSNLNSDENNLVSSSSRRGSFADLPDNIYGSILNLDDFDTFHSFGGTSHCGSVISLIAQDEISQNGSTLSINAIPSGDEEKVTENNTSARYRMQLFKCSNDKLRERTRIPPGATEDQMKNIQKRENLRRWQLGINIISLLMSAARRFTSALKRAPTEVKRRQQGTDDPISKRVRFFCKLKVVVLIHNYG
jgi:hypothetical protein